MTNTYTIQGLKVPEIDAEIAKVREELASLRTVFSAAVDAITRLDEDVEAIAGTLERLEWRQSKLDRTRDR